MTRVRMEVNADGVIEMAVIRNRVECWTGTYEAWMADDDPDAMVPGNGDAVHKAADDLMTAWGQGLLPSSSLSRPSCIVKY